MRSLMLRISTSAIVCAAAIGGIACQAQALRTVSDIPDSKVDIYLGYGWFNPIKSGINGIYYHEIYNFPNGTLSATRYFGRYLGAQAEIAYFSGSAPRGSFGQCRAGACSDRDPMVYTGEAGPIFRYPLGRFVPYAHVLGGAARINGPYLQKLTTGWAVTGGVGVDYVMPFWNNRIAVRAIQADYHYSQVDYGPLAPSGLEGGFGEIQAIKLSAGVVARFGGAATAARPVELGCTTQPVSVYPGEPVTANASIVNLKPGRQAFYNWTATSGRINSTGDSATVDTSGLAPGEYTVSVHMSYGRKATEQANCTAPFTVRAYEPPTISCVARPASATSGQAVTINAVGISPQNRPLTYSYATTAGVVTSSGPTAALSTAGLGPMNITVTCNIVDDLGKTASSSTQVTIEAAPAPVVTESQSLCSLSFERDRRRPARVDNEAKGCLDDIALTLNQRADAQLYIIANTGQGESRSIAAERALNIRQYLVQEKSVSSDRILLRDGGLAGRLAHMQLVPAGAIFNDSDTQPIDENQVVRHGEAYGRGHAATSTRRSGRRVVRRRGPVTARRRARTTPPTTPGP